MRMIGGRPASHIAAMLYFLTMAGAAAFGSYQSYQASSPELLGQLVLLAPFLLGMVALCTSGRWAYYYCAGMIFIFPAFLLASAVLILIKSEHATLASVSPLFIGIGLLSWLFYAFTFGEASKAYYERSGLVM